MAASGVERWLRTWILALVTLAWAALIAVYIFTGEVDPAVFLPVNALFGAVVLFLTGISVVKKINGRNNHDER